MALSRRSTRAAVALVIPALAGCASQRGVVTASPAAAPSASSTGELPLKLAPRPTVAAITPADLMTRLYIFADDSMMGRQVGTVDNLRGTAYIEREVRKLGLMPAGDSGTYFQNLPIVSRTLASGTSLTVGAQTFQPWKDYLPRDNGPTTRSVDGAQIVYGGPFGDPSGMISPDAVAGKVVVFTVPAGPDGVPRWMANRGALVQRYLGAAGIVIASLDAMPDDVRKALSEQATGMSGENPPMPVPAFIYTSGAMSRALFGAEPATLKLGTVGQVLHGAINFVGKPAPGRNVVAILRGSDPALAGEYVAIGAHNDHIGYTHQPVDHDSVRAYNSVVRPGGADSPDRPATAQEVARIREITDSLHKLHGARLDSIYNGADDDGSGTVSVLEIAEAFATSATRPKRSILFVWHTGEEAGLWGSQYFTDHPTVPRDSIVAQLNMDMVGRGNPEDVDGGGPGYVQLIGSRRLSTELGNLVESTAKTEASPFHFDYQYDANGHPQQYYCRSDHYMYARYGIPIVFFSTGGHRDYHQLTDEPQYINYDNMQRVAQLVHDIAVNVANLDHRVVVDHPKPDPNGQCVQ